MHSWIGIGVMSGSSLDGVDLSLCRYSCSSNGGWTADFLATETSEYQSEWIERLRALPSASAVSLAQAHSEYGRYIGRLIQSFQAKTQVPVDLVAMHGHTVFHRADLGYTFQLGEGEVVAAYCDCPLVNNLRSKDVALGGQGAPLVPIGERLLFPDIDLFLNLGGIVNMTTPTSAFDVCIGNQALNDLAAIIDPSLSYDPEGLMASSGSVDERLLNDLNSLAWFQSPPPKSLDREWYVAAILPLLNRSEAPGENKLATFVEHISLQIERAARENIRNPGKMLITGGGWHNCFLLDRLRDRLLTLDVTLVEPKPEELTLFKESLVFGFLGLLNLLGERNVDEHLTGASRSSIGGSLHSPPHRGLRTFRQFDVEPEMRGGAMTGNRTGS
ncbi:anhydro-N-acetylmuramic acid kinase [bacterium]|nr:anhydro-N-acetylmuramic acid kinase [bacterium]MDB4746299.1 anhydro-N-acetylmuramic acid kinase [Verrucomicrobiota bacterium]